MSSIISIMILSLIIGMACNCGISAGFVSTIFGAPCHNVALLPGGGCATSGVVLLIFLGDSPNPLVC